MILRSLTLENFGLYAGTVTLDVDTTTRHRSKRPIILIGGKNGVGKTTILEAVRLCLYGKRALGVGVAQSRYEDYLRSKVHRAADPTIATRAASVRLEFDFAELGTVHHYRVRRAWETRGKSVSEDLVVEQDGEILTDVRRSEWQDFLHDLIPTGVSQLFFFDGEKIQELAESTDDEAHLAAAVRSLLGLDLVKRLRDDLAIYLARNTANGKSTEASQLSRTTAELTDVQGQIGTITEALADARSQRKTLSLKAERVRTKLISQGGIFADTASLAQEKENVEKRQNELIEEVKHLANDLAPLAVAPRLTTKFAQWLAEQAGIVDRRSAGSRLQADLEVWCTDTQAARTADWTDEHWRDLARFLQAWVDSGHGVSPLPSGDIQQFQTVLANVEITVRPRCREVTRELDQLTSRSVELNRLLAREAATEGDELLEELRALDTEIGKADRSIDVIAGRLSELQSQERKLQKQKDQLERALREAAHTERRTKLAAGAARALEQYQEELTTKRIAQLQDEFVSCFNRLARKGDILTGVNMDPSTMAVTLVGQRGNTVGKTDLSAGEKQIYAISMLWALARTSGRPLPMIIDTPLARLDSDHRANLLERYFPVVSHQVIMLSTDTEVDEEYFEALRPHVARAFHLAYDGSNNRTVPEPGYFWHTSSEERQHALQEA